MTNTAITLSQSDIQALEQLYTLREPEAVLQFLDKYPFLVSVLLEAPENIKRYFPDSQLFLQVEIDPEIIDYIQLVLSICIKIDPYEATKRENQLDRDWWLNQPYEVRNQMFTTLEYPDDF